ncbi:general secretion pathway protein GspB [Aliiglaciecola sp. SL4]|uniref:general secretion pathway protein GspB n=1 Tax=Aliiglaciecola sp. SL4 TaxID=3239806 RepID=UPI00355C8DFE
MTQKISVEQLKVGMVIIKVTAQNGPVKIKKSGLVSSTDMVNALAEMGVQEVEIDPDMTVEVKKPKIAKSKTQKLVEDTTTVTQNIDQGISEQFNRSLFLPSVQELPEAWQYYGKKSLIASVVIAGGFCFGLILANLTVLTHLFHSSPDIVQTQPPVANDNLELVDSEVSHDEVDPKAESNIERANTDVPKPQQVIPEPLDEKPTEQKQISEQSDSIEETARLLAEQQAEEEQIQAAEESNIPPELLQRFRNALASLGEETPVDPTDNSQSIRDVPAVSELPAWVLLELPSLAFSAHMYVSAPEERWVRVNGKKAVEGQEIDDGLILQGIEPQHVIMTFKGQEFSMEALSDW